MFAAFVTLAISGALVAPNRPSVLCPDAAFTPISIAVDAPAGLSESLLSRIFAEADAIWEPAGIRFDWRRVASTERPRGPQLALTIENPHDRPAEWRAPLGWIFFAAGTPACRIHLSQANAEELVRRTPQPLDITFAEHERLIGRALGRAFSHELGHYILKSKAHTTRGLMRATWPSEQLLSVDRTGFELSCEQQDAARRWTGQIQLKCHLPL